MVSWAEPQGVVEPRMVKIDLPDRPKILVITLRRLGDVLMSTPLVRSMRRDWPAATLDMLVFAGSDAILTGNPDIDHVITMPQKPTLAQTASLVRQLFRKYDLTVSTQAGDRPTLYSFVAGRQRVGLVPTQGRGEWWKRRIQHRPVTVASDSHRYDELRALARALGIELHPDVIRPQGGAAEPIAPGVPYAVVHPTPFAPYRRWTVGGWRLLAKALTERGLAVVVSEGPDAAERAYVDTIWSTVDSSVIRAQGRLDWPGMAALLRGAAVYVGLDTSVTHLAAGCGCPTVALHGPSSPRKHAAWPVGGYNKPWEAIGRIQQRGNVWVVQNPLPCLPCEKLGCESRLDSHSQCLDELSAQQVLAAVDQALAWARERKDQWRNLEPGSGERHLLAR
jgi:heptosyltransferase-3